MEISSLMTRTLLLLLERLVVENECILRGEISYKIDIFKENEQVIGMNILIQGRGKKCHM